MKQSSAWWEQTELGAGRARGGGAEELSERPEWAGMGSEA